MNRFWRHGLLVSLIVASSLVTPGVMNAPGVDQPSATTQSVNPCSKLPSVCRYTYDPRENCCIADPRFDCYDVCF